MRHADRHRRRLVGDGGTEPRCDYCQSSIPVDPETMDYQGTEYTFCTDACREAMEARERVFTTYRGDRWVQPTVSALAAKLPQGIPRNSAVLISGQPGTREVEFQSELVWRALQRGEPAVIVAFREPPIAIIQQFLTLDWNVLPYLERGDLHILDCFTYRVEDRDRLFDRMNDWNTHLLDIAESEVTAVEDPSNTSQLQNRLDDCMETMSMVDRGIVLIDSLTEFGALVQPVRAYNFVKDIRADVAKARFVPVFASATFRGDAEQFPFDLEYLFDGIVDLDLTSELVEDALIKRLRVRKLSGALSYPEWTAYEFTSDDGLVMFDPIAEQESTEDDAAPAEPDADATDPDA